MTERVFIFASGALVRDMGKSLLERGLALSADLFDTFPFYMKNGRAKLGMNSDSIALLVDQKRLEEAMQAMRSMSMGRPFRAYAVPVLSSVLSG